MRLLLNAAIVPLFAVGAAAAQFVTAVNLTEVYATVSDAQGRPVTDLTAADFHVSEDGRPQTVSVFAAGEFPLSVVVAVDRSFSMAGERLDRAKRAAAAFIGALRPEDEVSVLAVGSEIEAVSPPVPARDAARTAWSAITPWGITPLYDAIRQSIDTVRGRKGRHALLIVSDGVDRGSEMTASDLIAYARRSDVLVYPVAIGKTGALPLAEAAGVTGGRPIAVRDARQLEAALTALAQELRTQYLLGYVPARSSDADAGWHRIHVEVMRPGVRVRSRDGYFSR